MADWLSGWKKAPSSRHTQRRDRLFSYIEHPTDNTRAVFRYFHPPGEGGQYGNGDYPPPDQVGGRNRRVSRIILSLSLSLSYIQKTAGPKAFLMSRLPLLEYS